jgi:Glutathione peroxidase
MKRFQDGFTRAVFGKEKIVTKTSFYELVDRDMAGKQVPMSTFAGKVLLVTNVASK